MLLLALLAAAEPAFPLPPGYAPDLLLGHALLSQPPEAAEPARPGWQHAARSLWAAAQSLDLTGPPPHGQSAQWECPSEMVFPGFVAAWRAARVEGERLPPLADLRRLPPEDYCRHRWQFAGSYRLHCQAVAPHAVPPGLGWRLVADAEAREDVWWEMYMARSTADPLHARRRLAEVRRRVGGWAYALGVWPHPALTDFR